MKLIPKGKYLYCKPDDVSKILSIQGSVGMTDGVIALPHNSNTYMELETMGETDIPHPMDNPEVFEYEGQHTPFEYQKDTAKYCTINQNAWVLNGMGSGKTSSAIWAAEFLRQTKEVYKTLVICPLSTIDHVWVRELHLLYPFRSIGVVTGTKQQKLAILRRQYDWYVLNHDAIRQDYIREELKNICPDLVILDEATAMKNGATARFKSMKDFYGHCGFRLWAMTGTPAPNGPGDIFAMQTLINPDTVPTTLKSWKSSTMWQVDRFKWVPKKGSAEIVRQAMQPAIRFERGDIPKIGQPVLYDAPLTPEQTKIFNAMRDEMVAEVKADKEHTILAVNAAVKLTKLLQICSGNVYDIDQDVVRLENKARLKVLMDVCDEAGARNDTKIIVFVPFKNSQYQLVKYLTEVGGYSVALVNGDTKQKDRGEIFRSFQDDEDPRILVAHPRVASHGLTLTAASVVVWYGPMFSLEMYEQGNARIARIGQEQDLTLVHIGSHKVEWDVYDIIMKKGSMQKSVLDLYAQIIN